MPLKYKNSMSERMTKMPRKMVSLTIAILMASMVAGAPALAADSAGGAGSLLVYQLAL